jgi:hypothetical protein
MRIVVLSDFQINVEKWLLNSLLIKQNLKIEPCKWVKACCLSFGTTCINEIPPEDQPKSPEEPHQTSDRAQATIFKQRLKIRLLQRPNRVFI